MKRTCANCGKELADGAMFCSFCGEKVASNTCKHCGKELIEGSTFCIYCGTKVDSEQSEPVDETINIQDTEVVNETNTSSTVVPLASENTEAESESNNIANESNDTVKPESDDSDKLSQIVSKNTDYYMTEFIKLSHNTKSRFNWAAFLFNGIFAYYRKCQDIFWKYYKLPIILTVIANVFTIAAGYYLLNNVSVDPNLITSIIAVNIGIVAYMLITNIRFGMYFNSEYYHKCKVIADNATDSVKPLGVSKKNGFLYWLAVTAYTIVLEIVIYVCIFMTISNFFSLSDYDLDDYDINADYSTNDDYTSATTNETDNVEIATTNDIDIMNFAGNYLCDSSTYIEDHFVEMCSELVIEPVTDTEILISHSFRGNYSFFEEYANSDMISSNTITFTTYNGYDNGTHTLEYASAEDTGSQYDVIFIDGDYSMPYIRLDY